MTLKIACLLFRPEDRIAIAEKYGTGIGDTIDIGLTKEVIERNENLMDEKAIRIETNRNVAVDAKQMPTGFLQGGWRNGADAYIYIAPLRK